MWRIAEKTPEYVERYWGKVFHPTWVHHAKYRLN